MSDDGLWLPDLLGKGKGAESLSAHEGMSLSETLCWPHVYPLGTNNIPVNIFRLCFHLLPMCPKQVHSVSEWQLILKMFITEGGCVNLWIHVHVMSLVTVTSKTFLKMFLSLPF